MFHPQLKICSDESDIKDKFIPSKYWISDSVKFDERRINFYIQTIQPNIKRTTIYGEPRTLHIGSVNEVVDAFGSKIFYVTPDVLKNAVDLKLRHFQVSSKCPQCVSLSLISDSISASGYSSKELSSIYCIVTLLGGKFFNVKEAYQTNIFITNNPILPPLISAFADQIPIVNKKWLETCFEKLEKVPFDNFYLPRFSSLEFVSSDLPSNQTKLLKRLVQEKCGKWSNTLNDSTTALVATRLSMTPKIKLALSLGIPIIKPQWIIEQSKCWTPIESYVLNFWCVKEMKSSLFSGISFGLNISCEEIDSLIEAVQANSGEFTNDPKMFVVPHFYEIPNTDQVKYVTTTWVWSCISEQKLIPDTQSIVYHPFQFSFSNPDLNGIVVAMYNIDEQKRYELSEGLRLLGISVHFTVSKSSNFIVAEKLDDELEALGSKYNIPIVSVSWVYKLLENNCLPQTDMFLLTNKYDNLIDALAKKIHDNAFSLKSQLTDAGDYFDNLEYYREKNSSPIAVAYDVSVKDPVDFSFNFDEDPLLNAIVKLEK
ncbi:DNA topoisomerase 2-binding protein 1 [Histomonas meleagridis]|uniref:DNA topoisomerase 2-binding protein 1 n=1 Tax=Histomonas meleagridis TaxID=135588 RepID=UPI00355A9D3C|nr:DNA topoisomerase 2-binding protein 1 [Histomonas meleagridis]KAH0800082.1 DNA topoisomerase 2-binding protein 1 [Histomonas meleagridis]